MGVSPIGIMLSTDYSKVPSIPKTPSSPTLITRGSEHTLAILLLCCYARYGSMLSSYAMWFDETVSVRIQGS